MLASTVTAGYVRGGAPQDIIDSKMEKRRRGVYGPSAGTKYILFVDDLNMPTREKYFAQPPIELLRQWCNYGGWCVARRCLARCGCGNSVGPSCGCVFWHCKYGRWMV